MTNSTPKSNKIVRHNSPNGKKWSPHQRKSVTYFASSTATSKEVTTTTALPVVVAHQTTTATKRQSPVANRQSCSPTNNKIMQPMPRYSPVRHDSPRSSPTNNFYAGAKFSEPPSPATLPKPPSHWTNLMQATTCSQQSARMMLPCNITQDFSNIISVQA